MYGEREVGTRSLRVHVHVTMYVPAMLHRNHRIHVAGVVLAWHLCDVMRIATRRWMVHIHSRTLHYGVVQNRTCHPIVHLSRALRSRRRIPRGFVLEWQMHPRGDVDVRRAVRWQRPSIDALRYCGRRIKVCGGWIGVRVVRVRKVRVRDRAVNGRLLHGHGLLPLLNWRWCGGIIRGPRAAL